jgi:glutamine synthetase
MHSRYEISLEHYIKSINIEALTMLDIAKRQILPAVIKFAGSLAGNINAVKATGVNADISAQTELLSEVSALTASMKKNIAILEKSVESAQNMHGDTYNQAHAYRFDVFEKMSVLRTDADKLETMVDAEYWPLPTYADMLFNV